eukprot:Clim_evm91s134 gene=Clim_evmTU91s134
MPKQVIFVRHSETYGSAPTGKDIDRELTETGKKDSKDQYNAMQRLGLPQAECALVSPAVRAQQTFDSLGVPDTSIKTVTEGLYGTDYEGIFDIIKNEAPDTASTIMIIGHNPGVADIMFKAVHEDLTFPFMRKAGGVSPGTFCHVEFPKAGSWKEVDEGTGVFKVFKCPEREELTSIE